MNRNEDRKIINNIPHEKLPDFILMHLRNMWSVDGLYYLGIEEKYGTEIATEIDKNVWKVMGKLEARRLKKLFNFNGDNLSILAKYLKLSAWVLDLEDKEIIEEKDKIIIRNIKCRIQDTRIQKGLSEFSCKNVRWGFLKSFTSEINPDIDVVCEVCPPDKHDENIWCEWIFKMS
jgi:hypothetical protein